MASSIPRMLTTFYFFLLGLWSTILDMILIWIAIDDILAGTLWPTALVLIAFSITDILAKVFSPFIISRISFHLSFALLTVLFVVSILLVVVYDDVKVRMAGVTTIGLTNGLGMITCLRMLAYYEQAELLANAFQNGRVFAVLLASLGYTGMTTWFCVAPRVTIAACIPICFFPLGLYVLIDKKPLQDHLKTTANLVQYTKLPDKNYHSDNDAEPSFKSTNKFLLLVKSFPLFIYSYLCNFSLQFTMTAVLTTLTFPSSPFLPRDHFQYYRLLSDAGMLIGGMGSSVVGCVGSKCNGFFRIRNILILAAINVLHLLFFVLASWYRFLPDVIPVLVLCFSQGIVHGFGNVQSAITAANLFVNPEEKGSALSILEVGLSVGRIVAALLGLITERQLREHCTHDLLLGRYCLARLPSSAGWSTNLICKPQNN